MKIILSGISAKLKIFVNVGKEKLTIEFINLNPKKKHHFYIYYEQVDISQLDNIEKQRIQKYDPHLNHSPVKTKQVRPVETLLRETIVAISDFAFILGVETPTQEMKFTDNINNTLRYRKNPQSEIIHIGFDFHLMKNKFNSTSQEEEEAIIKSIFQSRKTYSKKWEVIPKKYPLLYRLYVNNYVVEYSSLLNSFILQKSEDYFEYLDTTFAQESIKCLTSKVIEKLQLKIHEEKKEDYCHQVIKQLRPYTDDPVKLLFGDSIDEDICRKKLKNISDDYQSGRRGCGSRSELVNLDDLLNFRKISIDKYKHKIIISSSRDQNKIGLFVESFSLDPQHPIDQVNVAFSDDKHFTYNAVHGILNDKKIFASSSSFNTIYLLASVDKKAWLLFEDCFHGFAKLAIKLNEGQGFLEKFYISPRKFIVPAKVNLKLENLKYSAWIPFGFNPNFPTFESATQEIRRRLNESDFPDLKITFKRETTSQ